MEVEIEKTYQKKTQLEHILLRPDSYVGSIESSQSTMWVLDESGKKMVYKKIEYVPALYKIFDEILVNASDNFRRDSKMNTIKVNINPEQNIVSVWNNGKGIPIQLHKTYDVYVADLIFGHLLTSSNYDDNVKKITGGRNGFGAKLTNIFSTWFTVECGDHKSKKSLKMTWKGNMSDKNGPIIGSYNGNEDYTCITFSPDLKKFKMKSLDADIVSLMKKRVYDLAGILPSTVKIILNEERINIKGFAEYVEYYLDDGSEKIIDKVGKGETWEVIIGPSDGQFQQISFVNGICTSRGGTHVTMIADKIAERVVDHIKKKNKGLNVKPFQVKNYLSIFVNCLIENPTFDSQTKETLTTKPSQFGSEYSVSEKTIKELLKSSIIDKIVIQAKAKETSKMAKTLSGKKTSRVLGIPKLEDANDAGTKNSEQCLLILTEGDSAKSLAMAGIEVVGRDKFGVFPLKGKLLNVREATSKQITDNSEIQHITKALGLTFGKVYDNRKGLRYGGILIMADQDYDGSHIKSLIINFIHHFWPSLVKMPGFLRQFITPIIKVTSAKETLSFFSIKDYEEWKKTADIKKWKIKYYKGLGTSTDKEAKEYFKQIQKHKIDFVYDGQPDDDSIDLAFNKKRADDRKEWIANYNPNDAIDYGVKKISFSNFINKELIQFSICDNSRSIPNIYDGFKPGQRKIIYSCFKRQLKNEIKVAQLVGYVAEHSAYHHGENSLAQTIIGMAQNYVGSNNINLLMPNGQFGTRNNGGKDAASSRYIFTNLNKITRKLFIEHDDNLLNYLEDDGQSVEPEHYVPIIPFVLVNGCEGIGTGWSTFIPSYNPADLINNIKRKLRGEEMKEIDPWFKGFYGEIEAMSKKSGYTLKGVWEEKSEDKIKITELPVGKWTSDYKLFLETLQNPESGNPIIEDIKEYHSNNTVNFVIKFAPGQLNELLKEGIEKKLKLTKTFQMSNMVLFKDKKLHKYESALEILEDFYKVRLEFYKKRKTYLLSVIKRDMEILSMKVKFILGVITGEIKVQNVKKNVIIQNLIDMKFKRYSEMVKNSGAYSNEEDEGKDIDESSKDFNYLLGMPIWSLTFERTQSLKNELDAKNNEYNILEKTSIEDLWLRDLDALEASLKEFYTDQDKTRACKYSEIKESAESEALKKTKASKKSELSNSQKLGPSQNDLEDSNNVEAFTNMEIKKQKQEKTKQKLLKLNDDEENQNSNKVPEKSANNSQKTKKTDQKGKLPEKEIKENSITMSENVFFKKEQNKENEPVSKPPEKLPDAFSGLSSTLLKYVNLNSSIGTTTESKTSGDYVPTLFERLTMREKAKTDLTSFETGYDKSKTSISKIETYFKPITTDEKPQTNIEPASQSFQWIPSTQIIDTSGSSSKEFTNKEDEKKKDLSKRTSQADDNGRQKRNVALKKIVSFEESEGELSEEKIIKKKKQNMGNEGQKKKSRKLKISDDEEFCIE